VDRNPQGADPIRPIGLMVDHPTIRPTGLVVDQITKEEDGTIRQTWLNLLLHLPTPPDHVAHRGMKETEMTLNPHPQ